jgi:hypothetical protein
VEELAWRQRGCGKCGKSGTNDITPRTESIGGQHEATANIEVLTTDAQLRSFQHTPRFRSFESDRTGRNEEETSSSRLSYH